MFSKIRILVLSVVILAFGAQNKLFAGPLIVGNASGKSEFNIRLLQRQISYLTQQCQELPSCQQTLQNSSWIKFDAAVDWLKKADILFESDSVMQGKQSSIDIKGQRLHLNKSSLWISRPRGVIDAMSFAESSDFIITILEDAFSLRPHETDGLKRELAKVIVSNVTQYDLSLSSTRRLSVTNLANGWAGFAVIANAEEAEDMEFFDISDFATCEAADGTVSRPSKVKLVSLSFAFFTGPLTPSSDIYYSFHGDVETTCFDGSREAAHLRLTLKVVEAGDRYSLDRARTRVRFDSARRL